VRATEIELPGPVVESPENCLEAEGYCILKNLEHKYSFKEQGQYISISPDSVLVRQKQKEWSFVKGQVFIKTDSKITFEVPYGEIEVSENSQVLLEKLSDRIVVDTIFGKVLLRPLGVKKPILVMSGHENFITQVDATLKAQTGIPKPIVVEPLLKNWAYHTDLKKDKFLEEVENFKTVHEKAVQELSILNEQIANREIASAKAEKIAREERIRKAKERKEKMQNTYYDRLLTLPDGE
jgi:hypothetical protein